MNCHFRTRGRWGAGPLSESATGEPWGDPLDEHPQHGRKWAAIRRRGRAGSPAFIDQVDDKQGVPSGALGMYPESKHLPNLNFEGCGVESTSRIPQKQLRERVAYCKHWFESRKAGGQGGKTPSRGLGKTQKVICSRFAPTPSRNTLKNRRPGSTMDEAPIARRC